MWTLIGFGNGWEEETPHPALEEFPTAALLAPPGTVILPQHIYPHEIGHHGGITSQELLIPLIIA